MLKLIHVSKKVPVVFYIKNAVAYLKKEPKHSPNRNPNIIYPIYYDVDHKEFVLETMTIEVQDIYLDYPELRKLNIYKGLYLSCSFRPHVPYQHCFYRMCWIIC